MSKKNNKNESAGPKPVEPKAVTDYRADAKHNRPLAAPAPKAAPAPAAAAAPAATPAAAPAAAPTPAPAKPAVLKNTVQTDFSQYAAVKGPKSAPQEFTGLVRAVQSGDCLTLTVDGTRQERTITLSGIQAPRFARSRNSNDEAFAWAAREFLRKKAIGQRVKCVVNFSQPRNEEKNLPGRDYGTVAIANTNENLTQSIVKAGWATVKAGSHSDREALQALEADAQKAGLGVHNKEAGAGDAVRNIDWNPDARALFAKFKGQAVPAVIDQVRDGSTIRCELVPNANSLNHTMINLHLAGVQCPRLPPPANVLAAQSKANGDDDDKPAKAQKVEPGALEAQKCTEEKLLHRDVTVLLQGTDKFNNFFGTVVFPAGNISLYLLENGFAQLVEWSAKLTPDAEKYAAAQRNAQKQKLRYWKTNDPAKAPGAAGKDDKTEYRVVQINSGDTLILADAKENEQKVSLASIRAPRMGNAKRGEDDEGYAWEAREFLRKKLIGKKVKRTIDYSRKAAAEAKGAGEERPFATVMFGGQNVAELLVSNGLATVIKHRAEDPRASGYEALCLAEDEAKAQNKGLHNALKQAPVHNFVDLSERFGGKDNAAADEHRKRALTAKAKSHLDSLKRDQHAAVVEYVFTGSRLKLFVPKENAMISLALAGIRAPGPKDDKGKADPIGEQALALTRRNVLQQNVQIEVEDLDKGDNFIGTLFLNNANFSVFLVSEGLAKVFPFSADKSKYKDELYAAQDAAQKAKKGVWKNYSEVVLDTKAPADGKFGSGKEFENVTVTEVLSGANFFVRLTGDKNAAAVEKAMAEFDEEKAAPAQWKAGSVVAGQFNDGAWHRVRIEGRTQGVADSFDVLFVDYGNSDALDQSALKALPGNLAQVPALAYECVLTGLKAPSESSEYFDGAAEALNELIFEKPLLAKVDAQEGRKLSVTLYHEHDSVSVNAKLLADGWVRIAEKPSAAVAAIVEPLREHEEKAKRAHTGVWAHGDVSDEDESEAAGDWRDTLPVKKAKAAPKAAAAAAPAKPAAAKPAAAAGAGAGKAKK